MSNYSKTTIVRTPEQIGAAIRRLRKISGITQKELGSRLSLRQAKISEIENGAPGTALNTLCDVLAALELDLLIQPRSQSADTRIEDIF
jgi:HTH-type transcriptional regulator / antitoxin HipB